VFPEFDLNLESGALNQLSYVNTFYISVNITYIGARQNYLNAHFKMAFPDHY